MSLLIVFTEMKLINMCSGASVLPLGLKLSMVLCRAAWRFYLPLTLLRLLCPVLLCSELTSCLLRLITCILNPGQLFQVPPMLKILVVLKVFCVLLLRFFCLWKVCCAVHTSNNQPISKLKF